MKFCQEVYYCFIAVVPRPIFWYVFISSSGKRRHCSGSVLNVRADQIHCDYVMTWYIPVIPVFLSSSHEIFIALAEGLQQTSNTSLGTFIGNFNCFIPVSKIAF